MSGKSGIQWTDATWNPTVGCTRVSSGCNFCYAFQLHDQRHIAWKRGRWDSAPAQYHKPFSTVQLLPERLSDPLHWRKPKRVFVNSMSDLFHEDVPDTFIEQVFAIMWASPDHTFQILTKRPERMREWVVRASKQEWAMQNLAEPFLHSLAGSARERLRYSNLLAFRRWPLPNVWLGVSVEDQRAADERIPLLLQTPAAVRFLSCEPLLGEVDLSQWLWWENDQWAGDFHWCIIGGESGPHARVMNPAWAVSLVEQCRAAGVAVFMKQLGSELAHLYSLKNKHGGDMEAWPPDFDVVRVREFPQTARADVATAVTP